MKNTLKVGATSRFSYKVPAEKTVPHLYPEAYEFQHMPRVFATGFMVGLMEWTCLKVLEPHLDEGEGSLGIHIDVSHIAATVPGQTVTVDAECTAVDGRRIAFNVKAHDGIELIGEGRHVRMVVALERFVARVNQKAKAARVTEIVNPAKVQGQHG
jgi:fluoroacetyl-CoA thioesterase